VKSFVRVALTQNPNSENILNPGISIENRTKAKRLTILWLTPEAPEQWTSP